MVDDGYTFMQIKDATLAINQRVNIIAVVVQTSIPRPTKGTDRYVQVKIVDESEPSKGLLVNIFLEKLFQFPRVVSVGDILQLNQILMETHKSEVIGTFKKFYSSFALFEGKSGANFVPYQASKKYCAREQDKKFITRLRKWAADHHVGTESDDLLPLENIREGEDFNLVCKILHLREIRKDVWMLFVWDGTDAPSIPIIKRLEEEKGKPLRLQLEPISVAKDVIRVFPFVGTVLRVKIDETLNFGIKFLEPGKWVKFVNLNCEVHEALWSAVLAPYSRFCYLPDDNDLVLRCKRKYKERISKWGQVPSCSSHLTEIDYPGEPCVSLIYALTCPKMTAKFRCVVRIVDVKPWRAEEFYPHDGTCKIRLTLEDPTGRIYAYLYADNGINFFGKDETVDSIAKKRNKLLGIPEDENIDSVVTENGDDASGVKDASRNPPWVQCCLKSFYQDESDPWNTRIFHIFGTKFVG